MPALNDKSVNQEKNCFHIYNGGVGNKNIFIDKQDYEIFLDYLKQYLTPPANRDFYKKKFTVRGKTYKGVPHTNKNYHKDLNLLSYNLFPDHFHLLIQQEMEGSIEKFMRSISTRYSIYYNKKYKSSGPVFKRPYKSIAINNLSHLAYLTHYFHRTTASNNCQEENVYSSYAEYLGKRQTSWVKPQFVLSLIQGSDNKEFKSENGYKNFVENYEPDVKSREALTDITFEKDHGHHTSTMPVVKKTLPAHHDPPETRQKPRFVRISMASMSFIVLFSLGLNNVLSYSNSGEAPISTKKLASGIISEIFKNPPANIPSPTPTPIPEVEGVKTEEIKILPLLVIKAPDNIIVDIFKSPSLSSETILTAVNKDKYEYETVDSDWYKIKIDTGYGYVSSKYVSILESKD